MDYHPCIGLVDSRIERRYGTIDLTDDFPVVGGIDEIDLSIFRDEQKPLFLIEISPFRNITTNLQLQTIDLNEGISNLPIINVFNQGILPSLIEVFDVELGFDDVERCFLEVHDPL